MGTRRALQFDDLTIGDTIQVRTIDKINIEGVFYGFSKNGDGQYVMVLEYTLPAGAAIAYHRMPTARITRVKLVRCADNRPT